jgi:hypothetical protein
MRKAERRIFSSFDWFVVIVLLGYLLVVVQAVLRGGTPALPFTPSSRLWYDRVVPPTELPAGMEVSMSHARPGSYIL